MAVRVLLLTVALALLALAGAAVQPKAARVRKSWAAYTSNEKSESALVVLVRRSTFDVLTL